MHESTHVDVYMADTLCTCAHFAACVCVHTSMNQISEYQQSGAVLGPCRFTFDPCIPGKAFGGTCLGATRAQVIRIKEKTI